jgi:hypothetical protein
MGPNKCSMTAIASFRAIAGLKGQRLGGEQSSGMQADEWLRLVEGVVRTQMPDVDVSRPDDDMLTLALGTRGVVLHATGNTIILAPSFAAGGTIGSRLKDRVQHLEMTSYAITHGTVASAADTVVGHLRSA